MWLISMMVLFIMMFVKIMRFIFVVFDCVCLRSFMMRLMLMKVNGIESRMVKGCMKFLNSDVMIM